MEKRTSEPMKLRPLTIITQQNKPLLSYLGGFVYENNVLQFFNHEEERVRYKADNNSYENGAY